MLRKLRGVFSGWDPDLTWQGWRVMLLVVCVCILTGVGVSLALNWTALTSYAKPAASTEQASTAVRTPSAAPTDANLLVAPVSLSQAQTQVPGSPGTLQPASLAPARGPSTGRSSSPTPARSSSPTPTPLPTATATPIPTALPTAVPTAEQAWTTVESRLVDVWGVDTQSTIAILDAFHAQYPEYQPARDKLYAALLASAGELVQGGATQDAAQVLQQAVALAPERPEGQAALQALTPTPSPSPAPEQAAPSGAEAQATPPPAAQQQIVRAPPPVPVPAPVRIVPTPAPRPIVVAPPAPPTPTKAPFRPPAGP